MQITNKVFIVTGGASGLGEATMRMLVENNAKVIIADMNDERGALLERELEGKVFFVKADVSSEADGKQIINMATGIGILCGVINCAGIGNPARLINKDGSAHSLEYYSKVIQVNLIGSFNMIRLASAAMAQNARDDSGEKGVIINTASVAAYDGQIGQVAYAASKGGIVAMTLPVARELSRKGIRCMTIAPGIFETPMLLEASEEVKQSLGSQVPFPSRLGKPSEYASLVRHIIENQMLNGEVIRLDGAIRMAPK